MTDCPLRFDRVVYASHSGRLYGTERMALATLDGLRDLGDPLLLAPPGEVHALAAERQIATVVVRSRWDWIRQIVRVRRDAASLALLATAVPHSLAFAAADLGRPAGPVCHLHVVHGGVAARASYGRKRMLLPLPLAFVAVSRFVADELATHGVPQDRVHVVHNGVAVATGRPHLHGPLRRLLVVARVDPNKRLDLLLAALRLSPIGRELDVTVVGGGSQLPTLRGAARDLPRVHFAGFQPDVTAHIDAADLLVHTCPDEPFGLAIAEAMHCGLPVLVPDRGGPREYVTDGVTGFTYTAGSADALAGQLTRLARDPVSNRAVVAARARTHAQQHLSLARCIADYRQLLHTHSRKPAPQLVPDRVP